jgi:methyltransferase family protein
VTWRHSALKRLANSRGYQLVPHGYDAVAPHFYSPLPDLAHIPESLWTSARPLLGVDLRVAQAAQFMRDPLALYLTEFRPPLESSEGFYLENGEYQSIDAELLYAILRHLKPQRVVELGSGASSQVIAIARSANKAEGARFDYEIYDPFPFTESPFGPVNAIVHEQRGETIDSPAFAERLRAGDVLFVDTTHTVKTGGEVDHVILDILPRLTPGVWVHFHDIFLPWEYPREFVVDGRRAWAEQYLLQAFLAFNPSFQVEFPALAVLRAEQELMNTLVPSSVLTDAPVPGAFWISRL